MGERILVVSSGGGHLTEALHLVHSLDDVDQIHWAVPASGQSQTLLAGQSVWPIADVGPRQLGASLRLLPRAHRLLRKLRPTLVVSTGAAPAVPFLLTATLHGIPAHYVESLTRIERPSLTGRILATVPTIRCYSQQHTFGRRWLPIASPFDAYSAGAEADGVAPIRRVVVTVGTMRDYPFRSLVERALQLIPGDAEVLWQTGSTSVADLPITARPLVPVAEMRSAMAEADVIIGHAGCGTALDALALGRVPVLVPRRSARGEHVDDHQAQLAHHLAARGLAVAAEADELTLAHLQRAANSVAERLDAPALSLGSGAGRASTPMNATSTSPTARAACTAGVDPRW
jgi:UDP-N-acetylglucosamine--N-acetylmuramyl-(pentapeptide) pyrophosphoryl-undecaprenol N-acetylglucosamine transferase